jgi:radical SAM superfamily enzyme YgiQ (UPF0313 family)
VDVLIICTNRNRQPLPVVPYGACIVAEAAERDGHRVRLLDLMFRGDPLSAIEEALRGFPPDVIGLSVRNLDNNDMQAPVEFVSELEAIAQAIRRGSPAPIVLGGPAVGVMPEPLLRHTGASFAVLGDGESAFPALLRALNHGGRVNEAPRTAWLENGRYQVGPNAPAELVNVAITPEFHRWLNLRAYSANMATVPLQSKRGCPFTCIYCTYGISEGRQYRLASPEEVAEAVQRLAAMGCRDIEFVDNVFNAPYDHAMAISDHLAGRRHGARLTSIELNPAFVDDQLLKSMERAGFIGIGITAESAADPVLAGLQKGYTAAQVERAAEAVRRSRLPCFWLFLVGGPGETEATVAETIAFARRTLRPGDVAFFNVGIRIYPGTEMENIARREGVVPPQGQDWLKPVFYFSPELDLSRTMDRVRRAAAEKLNLLHAASLSHPWLPVINRLCRRLPLRPPLWRHTRAIRRVVRTLGRDI